MNLLATRFDTPLGTALAVSRQDGGLVQLQLLGPESRAEPEPRLEPGETFEWQADGHTILRAQLDDYFARSRREFELELAPRGTAFQQRVWAALQDIPYGSTTSYGALAAQLGQPTASRAVGLANGANPIWLVVPCHRVIGASGKLTGYAGGLDIKRRLLEHEGALAGTRQNTLAF